MVSDTTLTAPGTRTAAPDRTEPAAELLARLTPDDLHPARLTGPHAWHPWNLAARPPTDHVVRLVAISHDPDTLDRLLDHLQTQLQRPAWPPRPLLQVARHGSRLDCRDTDGRRGVLLVERRDAVPSAAGRDVVTREGWAIVDELAALNDRLDHIDPDQPSRDDLTDLAHWVAHKMTTPALTANLACPLPDLLRTQAAQYPDVSDRLGNILERGIAQVENSQVGALTYLQGQ